MSSGFTMIKGPDGKYLPENKILTDLTTRQRNKPAAPKLKYQRSIGPDAEGEIKGDLFSGLGSPLKFGRLSFPDRLEIRNGTRITHTGPRATQDDINSAINRRDRRLGKIFAAIDKTVTNPIRNARIRTRGGSAPETRRLDAQFFIDSLPEVRQGVFTQSQRDAKIAEIKERFQKVRDKIASTPDQRAKNLSRGVSQTARPLQDDEKLQPQLTLLGG